MNLVIICRDALVNSCVSTLLAAMDSKKADMDVTVIFISKAVYALTNKDFKFPNALRGISKGIEENAKKIGLSYNLVELIKEAKNAGIRMIVYSAWTDLMEVKNKLPEGMEIATLKEVLDIVEGAEQLIVNFCNCSITRDINISKPNGKAAYAGLNKDGSEG